MPIETIPHRPIHFRRLISSDLDSLLQYLDNLSEETKKRFGPHPFDKQSVIHFYASPDIHQGYVAHTIDTNEIIAYFIIKLGYLEGDYNRYMSYGIKLDHKTDSAFAPSVADLWQSCGIGNKLFHVILEDLKKTEVKRIILWGGVQADNEKAVNYYKKNKFKQLGRFSYHGENDDMLLEI